MTNIAEKRIIYRPTMTVDVSVMEEEFLIPSTPVADIINLSLMTMMSATGVLGIKNSSSITDTSTVIVGLYMILFSAILVIYEIIQIYPCSLIDNAYKRNFGFLYGLMGKSGFTVFMAVLSFGITDPQKLAFATGQSCTVICYHI